MNFKKIYTLSLLTTLFLLLFLSCEISLASDARPPGQSPDGPGGTDYNHTQIISSTYGSGALQYWIFEPASPSPSSAPVIIFNHGWSAINPIFYRPWINHLVKRGNIVIYPRYQANIFDTSDFTDNAIYAVKDGLEQLEQGDHVRPETENMALVGHSAGGLISINMAARALDEDLPQPKAIFCVQPGVSRTENQTRGHILEDLSLIPADTLLLTLSSEEDDIVGSADAEKIIRKTTNIPLTNKNHVIMVSDYHGNPPLIADHLAPLAIFHCDNISLMVNALDYYGTWKLFDGLYEAAFYGENQEYALGDTSKQRFMGFWSDGTAVKELKVST